MTDPEPLWLARLDDGGQIEVHALGTLGLFVLRVTVPHPDYLGPDVTAERTVTRERLRHLWNAVRSL